MFDSLRITTYFLLLIIVLTFRERINFHSFKIKQAFIFSTSIYDILWKVDVEVLQEIDKCVIEVLTFDFRLNTVCHCLEMFLNSKANTCMFSRV